MLLTTFAGLQWYGNASGALVDTQPDTTPSLDIKATKRLTASIQGGEIEPYIKGTMGKTQTLIVQGIGELHLALPKKIGTMALSVEIGATPSAFDIAQAVWLQAASAVNVPGTTGEKLTGAGSSGDPWTSPKALTVGKFLALK